MSNGLVIVRARWSLGLAGVLHAFTHAYGTMLVPLYVVMAKDIGLTRAQVTLIVTIYSLVYCLGSFFAGVLADRFNRKRLLAIGLIGNAAAVVGMGLTRQYEVLVAMAVLAGMFGTLFHPTANALVTAHWPDNPGMAVGLLGMGAGVGFFFGPQYAGWRAQMTGNWQVPCIEMGLAGFVMAVLFIMLASEVQKGARREGEIHPALGKVLRQKVIAVALVLMLRDFAGAASFSLASFYLQNAMGMDVKRTGLILGTMMLSAVVANPLGVWISGGRRRLPGLAIMLVLGGGVLSLVPWARGHWQVFTVLGVYQALQLGSFAVSDAAILERVPPVVRGRVVGLFLTLAGTFASSGPWAMGWWTDAMRERAGDTGAYVLPFVVLGVLLVLSAGSVVLIARIGPAMGGRGVAEDIDPGTMEVVV